MQFNAVIGQPTAQNILRNSVRADRMPHAQLFLGPEGSGKLALALAFAQYALCSNRGPEEACGTCPSCIKAAKNIHPDVHFSFPVIGSKATSNDFLTEWRSAIADNPYMNVNQWLRSIGAENKQGNIGKEECVNIIRKLSLKSFESSYKILLLWLPEYLGKEGNRLLKLIEEPPEDTLFVLIAENQELILNTIISRCQIVKIPPLADEAVAERLVRSEGIGEEEAQQLALLANGNYNEARQLAAHNENDNALMFLDWLRKCYKGNGVELVTWVEKFASIGRENQKHFLQYALHFMREYLRLKLIGNQGIRLQGKELTTAQNMLKVIEYDQVEKITKLFDDCSYYVERNANPKVLFLDTSIQIHRILRPAVVH